MRWSTAAAFGLLCLWQGSQWLFVAYAPGVSVSVLQGLGCALIFAVALGWKIFHGGRWQRTWRDAVLCLIASLLMMAIPSLLLERAREYSPDANLTVCFTFAPAVAIVMWNAVASSARSAKPLVAALAGAAGVLLILPFEPPVSVRGWEALIEVVVAMLIVAASNVWMHLLLRRWSLVDVLLFGAAVNSAVLLSWSWGHGQFAWGWTPAAWSVVNGAAYFGTVFLLQRMLPVRFVARFLFIPGITLFEGIVLLRPEWSVRLVLGLALVTVGVAALFRREQGLDNEVLSLR
jgi:drug/metabolite transporter (DMT)-like permease